MAAFLDTSALIKHFVEETGTEEVRRIVVSETPLWVSELTTIEGVSGRCEIIPLDDEGKERARTILSTWALSYNLGSLDALQLAEAVRAREDIGSMNFYSADRRLLAAAQAQGFTVKNPGVAC